MFPTHPPRSPRADRRADIATRLLDGLDALVRRHRALTGDAGDLHAELITAEVAHELALARGALTRTPALASAPDTTP